MVGEKWSWQRSLTRRRVLTRAAAGSTGLAVGVLIGCRRGERAVAPSGAPAAQAPKRGGTITYGGGQLGSWDLRGTTLDPHINSALGAVGFRLFYQGLLGYHPRTYEVEPEIAQRWEQPAQTEYLFTLQPGVKWHNKPPANGRDLTVQDVVFSLNRARTNDPRFQHGSLFVSVDKIEAVDRATLRVTTKTPDAAVLSKLAADGPLMLAPEVVERAGKFATADVVVGTGPFVMKSVEEGVSAEYVRNPEYWKPGRPYLDGLRTVQIKDEQAGYAAFQAGQVDIARLNGTLAKDYIARRGAGYTPDWFKDITVIFATPNVAVKPMDDSRVTRALRLLMDHDEFKTAWAEVWFGRGRHGSIFCTALDQWDLTEEEYARHIAWKQPRDDAVREALALLSAAGFTRDTPLRFELAGHTGGFTEAGTQLLQAQWRRLGQGVVDTTIKTYELAQALQVQAQGSFTYGVWGLGGATTEPDAWLTQLYHSAGSRNRMNFKDPQLDAMIDRQRTLFDIRQRKAAVREIIVYMLDHSPGVIISNRYFLNAVNPKVRDYAPEFYINGRQYEWIWLDT